MTDSERPTWTDEDILNAAEAAYGRPVSLGEVLYHRRVLAYLGAVHPAEAREREREAIVAYMQSPLPQHEYFAQVLPSLLPKSPPPLVLSTGEWRKNGKHWDWNGDGIFGPPRLCATATDAEKLAAWLREYGAPEERQ